MDKKGSILELKKNCAIVMTEDCRFLYVKRNKKMFVGQQIYFNEKSIIKSRSNMLKYTKLVACFIIIILVSIIPLSSLEFYGSKKAYAYVDIDINPSLEISISKDNKVLSATSINEDGKVLLKNLKLEGKTLEAAIDEILNQSRNDGYIKAQADNYVLISASLTPEVSKGKKNLSEEEEKLSELIESFKGITGEKGKERIDIEVISTNPEIIKEANENGISMGKYQLYLKAKDMGLDFSIDEIKNSSIADILKKLNMGLIDSDMDTKTNSAQDGKVNNDSNNKPKINPPSNSAQNGKVNSDSNNKTQVNSSSNSEQNNNTKENSVVAAWSTGVKYDVGTMVSYNNNNYKCILAHTSQVDWIPPNVPTLWQKQVAINSNNTWQTAVNYTVGTLVIYEGVKYKCIQAHMSMQGLEPINVPALWQKQ